MNIIKLTELKDICNDIIHPPACDYVAMNNRYGHAYHLKKYARIDTDSFLNCPIEHGLNIENDSVISFEVSQNCSKIITFSNYRKDIIEKYTDLNAITVGPYIAYADSYYDDDLLNEIKSKLKRTLLVFPSHNAEIESNSFDYDIFIKSIKELSKEFDSVVICLYYLDVKEEIVHLYKQNGFSIVTAGAGDDIRFLSRLKSIILLADAVAGNDFTTGLAYSLYLDKPIYMIRQTIVCDGHNRVNTSLMNLDLRYLNELYVLASDPKFGRLNEQKNWANYMFGLDCVKSVDEMHALLKPMIR